MVDVKSKVCRDSHDLKLFQCFFSPQTLCSYRKTEQFSVMERCFSCPEYKRFGAEMEREEEDFFVEVDRQNQFAKCMFEDCPCDSEPRRLVCFGSDLVGGNVWKCRRFDAEKLPADSMMRETYLELVKGLGWK